ncbi:MAG: phage terminase large subunit, partial [Saprospiraceae bacterium]|nr:phage terminase large subunit [Saprospiraceae bacterium]
LRVMNPSRKPKSVIDQKENEHTAEDFAGQYGQNPQPAEGNKLKKKWFTQRFIYERFIDQAGANLIWNAVLDGAYTKNTKNSATACLIYASYGNKLYLYDYRSWWLEFPEIVDSVPSFVLNVFDPRRSTLFVEPKAIGKSLVQTLRKEGGINIVEDELPQGVTQMQGKEMRVDNITPYCRGMNIILRDGVEWQPFIDQCATFPNASHSDLVDCLVMAVEKVQFNSILSDPDFYS